MTKPIVPNPEVVAGLLARYTFTDYASLLPAHTELTDGVRLSMEHTAAYSIPINQLLPPEVERTAAAPYVHPLNLAAALLSVYAAGQQLGGAPLALVPAPDLQVYNGDAWQLVVGSPCTVTPLSLAAAPLPVPVAPPPPPVPLPPTAAQADLVSLVDAALGSAPPSEGLTGKPAPTPRDAGYAAIAAPSTVAATPIVATPPVAAASGPVVVPRTMSGTEANAKFGNRYGTDWEYEAEAAPETPITDMATLGVQGAFANEPERVVASQPALAAPYGQPDAPPSLPLAAQLKAMEGTGSAPAAPAKGLPDASVLAERKTAAGRPQKSPFERPVEARNKVAAAPFWWEFLRYSASKVLTESPAAALDPSSSGSGPIQSYALLIALLQDVLRGADGDLTVAELRLFLNEIETGMTSLPSGKAIYQLVDHLFEAAPASTP